MRSASMVCMHTLRGPRVSATPPPLRTNEGDARPRGADRCNGTLRIASAHPPHGSEGVEGE